MQLANGVFPVKVLNFICLSYDKKQLQNTVLGTMCFQLGHTFGRAPDRNGFQTLELCKKQKDFTQINFHKFGQDLCFLQTDQTT